MGVGASVVNAYLQPWRSMCAGWQGVQPELSRGRPLGQVAEVGPGRGTGTTVRFTPDDTIPSIEFDPELIANRLEVKTYLHKGLRIIFRNETATSREDRVTEFRHEGGILEYLSDLMQARNRRVVIDSIFGVEKDDQDGRLEIALTWTESTDIVVHSFVNGIPTHDGGTHEAGSRCY